MLFPFTPSQPEGFFLSRFRGMMHTPRLAARSFIPVERSEIFLQIRHCIALGRCRQPMTVRWRQDARSNP